MITRRRLFKAVGAGTILAGSGLAFPRLFISEAEAQAALNLSPTLPEGTRAGAILDALPGKKPLIKLSYRPPNYETPIEYFRTSITRNEVFFVRYHLSNIAEVDAKTWKMAVGGEG